MAPPNEHIRRPSQADIPSSSYQILYEFERRLDEKLGGIRAQTKEDIKTAIDYAVLPLANKLSSVIERMDAGNKRFEQQDARLSEHSDKIEDALALARAFRDKQTASKQKHSGGTDEFKAPKKSIPWWLPLLIGGALTFLGERATRVVINALADPPAASKQATP